MYQGRVALIRGAYVYIYMYMYMYMHMYMYMYMAYLGKPELIRTLGCDPEPIDNTAIGRKWPLGRLSQRVLARPFGTALGVTPGRDP